MAEFVAIDGLLKGLVLSLVEGHVWVIGRDPDECDLIVEDPKASRKHLICTKVEEGYLLENLSHSNPTKVNDHQILEPTLLRNRDKVQIGGTHFRFFTEKATTDEEEEETPLFTEPVGESTIFNEEEVEGIPEVHFAIESSRFIFKVVAGPNTGAELALEEERVYVIGTDTETCDIVFHDLSISRNHAKLRVSKDGLIHIEDLDSRNGVIIDRERISGEKVVSPNTLVTVGTSVFLVIDKEAPMETIAAPLLEEPEEETEEWAAPEEQEAPPSDVTQAAPLPKKSFSSGTLLLSLFCVVFLILLGLGMISLFHSREVHPKAENHQYEIQKVLDPFPQVKFTFNAPCNRLFLLGHVANGLQKSEMLYNIKALPFVKSVDDHVVDDEAVWQEMNILLSKIPEFEGVSMHSPEPGKFVLTGFLKTAAQSAALTDYMNLNFNYLDRLENLVVVQDEVMDEVKGQLLQHGLNNVMVDYSNGLVILTGYIPNTSEESFQMLVAKFSAIPGIRGVRNYVVALTPEQAVVNLTNKYRVTGFSKHGDINVNVVINGCILSRGDTIDGLTITSIQAHTIFLEKDGLKYKIEYNIRECKL